jgi:hypothetical protein
VQEKLIGVDFPRNDATSAQFYIVARQTLLMHLGNQTRVLNKSLRTIGDSLIRCQIIIRPRGSAKRTRARVLLVCLFFLERLCSFTY